MRAIISTLNSKSAPFPSSNRLVGGWSVRSTEVSQMVLYELPKDLRKGQIRRFSESRKFLFGLQIDQYRQSRGVLSHLALPFQISFTAMPYRYHLDGMP